MTLVVKLERELPAWLPAGTATALFCVGACFDTRQRVEAVSITVGDVEHPVSAFSMPRPDLAAQGRLGAGDSALSSGFWGSVPVTTPDQTVTIRIALVAQLADGSRERAELGSIEVSPRVPRSPVTAADPASIAVCMATYEPDLTLFKAQIESLRLQDDAHWMCLISDDCSSPERFAQIRSLIGDDPRFTISRSEHRLGFYRNFERALEMVPPEARLIALCDQDDRWHADKLSTLRAQLGDAIMIYSDQRLVDADGRVLRDTLWKGRSNNYRSLASLLVANTITGAATLFTRELLELVLPFPDTPGFQFHDTWIAVAALAAGRVAYVDRPLYDYVQHPGAVFGDVTHGQARSTGAQGGPRRRLRQALTAWRAAYFYGYLARAAQAQVALLRCDSRLDPAKRRTLQRFLAADHSLPAMAWLAARPTRLLLGHTETLGTELGLVRGLLWKRWAAAAAAHPGRAGRALIDASIPPPQLYSEVRMRRWRARV